MKTLNDLSTIQDDQLLENFAHAVQQERESIGLVVAHLAEIDKRKLYAKEGYSSLFSYCVEKFSYSEEGAYRRNYAARISQQFPEILDLLESGKITLTTIRLVGLYLKPENKDFLLKQVTEKSKRQVEKILASLFPNEGQILDKIRRLPLPKLSENELNKGVPGSGASTLLNSSSQLVTLSQPAPIPNQTEQRISPVFLKEKPSEKIKPVTAQRVKIEFSASEELAENIERAKQVLRHKFPAGKLEEIFQQALEDMLEKRDPERKVARAEKKQRQNEQTISREKNSAQVKIQRRYIPQAIQHEVWKRDGGQCAYVSSDGKRCSEHGFLELDHVRPWSVGGDSTVENLRLLCRGHNQWRVKFQLKQA